MLKPIHIIAASSEAFEISGTADEFASDSDTVHLVVDELGQAEDLGFRQCDLPIVRK
jgi:hypothetical protein